MTSANAPLVHVGRQAIYDRLGDVFAYELLFRDAPDAVAASRRGAPATGRVIVSAFTEFGLNQLVGSRTCFINLTREFLVGELPVPFEPDQAVLEVVHTVDVDDGVVDGVAALVERGFTVALEGFTWGARERLLELATYVKIDMIDTSPDDVVEAVRRCRAFPHLHLVAQRLETEEQLRHAFEHGFDLFQGHVLGRPHVVSMVGLSPARASRLQLVAELTDPEVDLDRIVALVTVDPAISFRLLHAANAAASGLTARVSSVREAAVLLGLDRIRQWVTLMVLSELGEATEEQLSTTMTRARLCQTVAQRRDLPADAAFTVGLLSGVAELLGQSPAELADELPLSDLVRGALTGASGDLGAVLAAVRDYDRGEVSGLAELTGADPTETYLNAVCWSNSLLTQAPTDVPGRVRMPD